MKSKFNKVSTYYDNGSPKTHVLYKEGALFKSLWFYSDGQLKAEETYNHSENIIHRKNYYDNGVLRSTENFKDNKLDGKVIKFYINGELSHSITYADDGIISFNMEK